jgi:hypothetical protein
MDDANFRQQFRTCCPRWWKSLYDFPQQAWGMLAVARLLIAGAPWYRSKGLKEAFRRENAHANSPETKDLDWRIEALCSLYAQASPEQRQFVRKRITLNFASSLLHFAWRKAVQALRTRSAEAITNGLVALSIENERLDYRDSICCLGLLYHAAQRIGTNPDMYFDEAAVLSTETMAEEIRGFLRRSPEHKNLSAVGFKEGSSEFGATLERVPWTPLT